MKHRISSAIAALVPALLLACGSPHHPSAEQAPEPAVVRARVATATVSEEPILIELQGSVEAKRTATISTRVMAIVTEVHGQVGDPVATGQRLLSIDATASQGQVSQARGALAQAQAGLVLAERNFERFQALAAADAASELEVDMARMQLQQARGAVEQGEGAVAAAASVAADSRVVAPFAGRVAERMVEVGDLAAPGRPLMRLESEGDRRLALVVPESLVVGSGLAIGQEIPLRIDSRPDLGEITGEVVEMHPGADPMSHTIRAKVALGDLEVRSGAAGRASLVVGSRATVSVPRDAVLRQGGLELVVLEVNGRTSSRAVSTGRPLAADRLQILAGLNGGERLLVGLGALPMAGSPIEEIGP